MSESEDFPDYCPTLAREIPEDTHSDQESDEYEGSVYIPPPHTTLNSEEEKRLNVEIEKFHTFLEGESKYSIFYALDNQIISNHEITFGVDLSECDNCEKVCKLDEWWYRERDYSQHLDFCDDCGPETIYYQMTSFKLINDNICFLCKCEGVEYGFNGNVELCKKCFDNREPFSPLFDRVQFANNLFINDNTYIEIPHNREIVKKVRTLIDKKMIESYSSHTVYGASGNVKNILNWIPFTQEEKVNSGDTALYTLCFVINCGDKKEGRGEVGVCSIAYDLPNNRSSAYITRVFDTLQEYYINKNIHDGDKSFEKHMYDKLF